MFNLKILDSGYFYLPSLGIKKAQLQLLCGQEVVTLIGGDLGKAAEIKGAV